LANKLVLKENLVFMVSREDGDVSPTDQEGFGLYYKDTRYLSILELSVNGYAPALLTSSGEFNFMGNIQSANPLMQIPIAAAEVTPEAGAESVTLLPRTLSIRRNRFIEDGLHERVGFRNYNAFAVTLNIVLRFGSDFRDMFDVRGYNRPQRGEIKPPEWDPLTNRLRFSYLGLDKLLRTSDIIFDSAPTSVELRSLPGPNAQQLTQRGISLPYSTEPVFTDKIQPTLAEVKFEVRLEPEKPWAITYHVVPQGLGNGLQAQSNSFDIGARRMRQAYEIWFDCATKVSTDDEVFNNFLKRSLYDLRILTEELPTGLMPVAGIPWFAVPFGRDSMITALQSLVFDPQLAVGTLRFLAQYQGKAVNDWNEETPGKILHEIRFGEMTVLHEMPHVPYYGAVDSTPLFIILFVETMRWLNSDELYQELLPNIKAALHWIEKYGDMDRDGFIEYLCHNERGVLNQGWKDNRTSLQFKDGSYPEQPIALCEAQGYVYAAKVGLATVVEQKGEQEWATQLRQEAALLKQRFNQKFWLPELNFFAQALDKYKTPITTITSNPGHCLWSGIIDADKVEATVRRLTAVDMRSGWGIRTVGENEPSYNPMSYHNGSIWPHDNSLIAYGLKLHGYYTESNDIISQVFAASQRFRYLRLPELFCGFQQDNRYYSSPAEYPVSCSPQAWTAGAALLFVQTLLGLQPNATSKTLHVQPYFPNWLNEITVDGLAIGNQHLSFKVSRQEQGYKLELLKNEGGFTVIQVS
jgi:glycogen debranching enzyme